MSKKVSKKVSKFIIEGYVIKEVAMEVEADNIKEAINKWQNDDGKVIRVDEFVPDTPEFSNTVHDAFEGDLTDALLGDYDDDEAVDGLKFISLAGD